MSSFKRGCILRDFTALKMYDLDSNPKSRLAFLIVDAFANDLVGPVMEILERFPMRGTVIAYSLDVNAGVIRCEAGNTYNFSWEDWNGERAPAVDQNVTFLGNSRTAMKVIMQK